MWKTHATNTSPGSPELGASNSILLVSIRTSTRKLRTAEWSTN